MKVYVSPSTQERNIGPGNYNEEIQMNIVADKLIPRLIEHGFEVKRNTPTMNLEQVTKDSNSWGADIHVAIHSNAGGGEGTEIWVHKKGFTAEKLALAIYKYLAPLSPGKDRGVKENASYYETAKTNAPAVIIEVAFHDSLTEANWIMSNYEPIAEAILQGICEFAGVAYKKQDGNVQAEIDRLRGALISAYNTIGKALETKPAAVPAPVPQLPSMDKLSNCHVITVKPDRLEVVFIKGPLGKDGINGGYFDGSLNPLGILLMDGKRITDRVSWRPARAVFAIRHDGKAEILPAVDSISALDTSTYKYALGAGPNLLPIPATTEGFQDDIMASNRPRSAVGITADDLVKLVATDSMTLTNLSKLMASLGCVQAMNLDGGGSSQMRFGSKVLRSGDGRKLATAILLKK